MTRTQLDEDAMHVPADRTREALVMAREALVVMIFYARRLRDQPDIPSPDELRTALAAIDAILTSTKDVTGGVEQRGDWVCRGGTKTQCHVYCTCDGLNPEDIDPRL